MVSRSDGHTEITDRDLQRVMAARRALRAYEPYGPPAARATDTAPVRVSSRTRAAADASAGRVGRARSTA